MQVAGLGQNYAPSGLGDRPQAHDQETQENQSQNLAPKTRPYFHR
jgi:hypothetical protein